MILWIVLFCLVLALSFVLAARSMRDFQEFPVLGDYSLFLIKNPKNLTTQVLSSITNLLKSGQILSFERLFKGGRGALVVLGPKELISRYNTLDLLELEDYTKANMQPFSICQVGINNSENQEKIPVKLPLLESNEQFWWQLILASHFKVQIKAVLSSLDEVKRASLADVLQNLAPGRLFMLPKVLSDSQILKAYQKRIFLGDKKLSLNAEKVLQLLFI